MSDLPHHGQPMADVFRVGFVGVGTISSAMVEALMTGPHAGRCEITLSPRSAVRSSALAAQYPQVEVAHSNQAVADAAEIVILGVLPGDVEAVCSELTCRGDHTVVGVPAGWPPSRLASVVAPAMDICQLIPLPMISNHAGPVVLHPENRVIAELFEGCDKIVMPPSEADVPVLSAASSVMSSYFEWRRTVTEWMTRKGIAPEVAAHYIAALFHGLAVEGHAALEARDSDAAVGLAPDCPTNRVHLGAQRAETSSRAVDTVTYTSFVNETQGKALVLGVTTALVQKSADHAATLARYVDYSRQVGWQCHRICRYPRSGLGHRRPLSSGALGDRRRGEGTVRLSAQVR